MKKLGRFLFAVMYMVLFLGMAPMTAEAAEETNVIVGGTTLSTDTYYKTDANGFLTADGNESDYNVKVVKDTTDSKYILTLNNATIAGGYVSDDDTGFVGGRGYKGIVYNETDAFPLEIKLEGANTINVFGTSESANTTYTVGIMASNNNLFIGGEGTLEISAETSFANSHCYGIYVFHGNVVFNGGTVGITTGVVGSGKYSIAVSASEDGNVEGSGTITVNGGTITTQVATNNTGHIVAFRAQNVVINNGTVTAITGDTAQTNGAIKAYGDITIAGGTVTAIVGDADYGEGYYSYAIYAYENMNICGGTVYANCTLENGSVVQKGGGANTGNAVGICAGDISISDGNIYVYSGVAKNRVYGIQAEDGIEINGGEIIATAAKAIHDSIGIKASELSIENATVKAYGGSTEVNSCGIYSVNFNISGGTVEAVAGNAVSVSSGIAAYYEANISGSANVTAKGGKATDGNSYGIASQEFAGGINISGGTVVAEAGTAAMKTDSTTNVSKGYSYGIGSNGQIVIAKETDASTIKITATGGEASKNSFGIGSAGDLTISSGEIEANGSKAAFNSYGIGSYGNLKISGNANITAEGGNATSGNSFGIGIAKDEDLLYDPTPSSPGNYTPNGGTISVSENATVTATGSGAEGGSSFGVAATENVSVSGGTLIGNGGAGGVGSCGIYVGLDLSVTSGGNVQGKASNSQESVGVGAKGKSVTEDDGSTTTEGGNITVDGGTLIGTAGNSTGTNKDSMGVASTGTINVENAGSLTGTGGNSSSGRSLGVASETKLSVEGSTLIGQGGSAGTDSLGVSATNSIMYKNSEIDASGGNAGGNSYGTASEGNISFEGGSVNVSGGTSTNGISYGAGAYGTISLKDTDLTGFGNNGALGGANGFTNNNTNEFKLFVSTSNTDSSEWNGQDSIGQYKYARNTNVFYTVTFVAGEGSGTMNSISAPKDGLITLPENGFNAPANKEFDCWKIDNTEYEVGDTYTVSANITVTAQWKFVTHVVTYKVDGEEYATVDVEHGSDVPTENIPTIPTKEGYTQTSPAWDDDGKNVTADRIINAVYTINKYTVTYKAGNTTVKTVIVEHGSDVADADIPNIPAKDGYTQTAPTWDNDGSNVTEDRIINAVYTINTYTVTYSANGGTGTMDSAVVSIGTGYTLENNGFTAPENQKFKAWQIGADIYAEGAQITVTADVTIKALWEDITYVVSYDANGGSGTMTDAIATSGKEFTLPICGFVAAEDMQFKAWDVNGTEYQAGDKVTFTANTTIKAVWERVSPNYSMTSIVPPVFEGSGTVVATSDGEFSKFRKVEIDGNEIRKDVDYTAVSGSTIVTLQEEYLKTLAVGQHEVKIIFVDGEVSGNFEVKEAVEPTTTPEATVTPLPTQKPADAPAPTAAPTAAPTETPAQTFVSPKTGAEDMSIALAIVVMIVAASGMVACVKKRK